jgi:hypothetical protein
LIASLASSVSNTLSSKLIAFAASEAINFLGFDRSPKPIIKPARNRQLLPVPPILERQRYHHGQHGRTASPSKRSSCYSAKSVQYSPRFVEQNSIDGTVRIAISDGFRQHHRYFDDLNTDLAQVERQNRRINRRVERLERLDGEGA